MLTFALYVWSDVTKLSRNESLTISVVSTAASSAEFLVTSSNHFLSSTLLSCVTNTICILYTTWFEILYISEKSESRLSWCFIYLSAYFSGGMAPCLKSFVRSGDGFLGIRWRHIRHLTYLLAIGWVNHWSKHTQLSSVYVYPIDWTYEPMW